MHRFTKRRILPCVSLRNLPRNLPRNLLRTLGAGALVAALGSPALASAPSATPPRTSDQWMPDVRERVLDLRERTRRAAEDARVRRNRDVGQGQWWRAVAARPSPQVTR